MDTDLLGVQRATMTALGFLAQATLGTTTVADGLACTAQVVPNMTVNVGPGSITSLSTVDGTAFGSLAADNSDALVKQGINLTPTVLTLTAPTTSGQSINYLVEAAFQESDASAIVLPYYNASNPAVPYSGPANAGTAQNTLRLQRVNIQLKAGVAASTGSQATPTPDSGFVGLWVVTVAYAATSVVAGNISLYPAAPFVAIKLAQLPQSIRYKVPASYSVYVSTAGNDNTGLGTSASPWATIQHAMDVIAALYDLNGNTVTIQLSPGTYAGGIYVPPFVGAGRSGGVTVNGSTASPASYVVSAVNASCFLGLLGSLLVINGLRLTATGTASGQGCGIYIGEPGAFFVLSGVDFNACANSHMLCTGQSEITLQGNYAITGGAQEHAASLYGGLIECNPVNVAVSAGLTFNYFAYAVCGYIAWNPGCVFSSTAVTGSRFIAGANGVIATNGTSQTSFFPGSTAGTQQTGGLYQ